MAMIWEWIMAFGLWQWLAVFFNLLYVLLAIKENIWCWFFGFIGVLVLFFLAIQVRLYSDALLQVFYMIMSIYGWLTWKSRKGKTGQIRWATYTEHILFVLMGSGGTLLLVFVFKPLGAALPFIDAFTSAFAIIATFMVAYKMVENWIYWIWIDLLIAFMYWNRDLILLSFLFIIYTIFAVAGYLRWRRKAMINLD